MVLDIFSGIHMFLLKFHEYYFEYFYWPIYFKQLQYDSFDLFLNSISQS